nr:interleukin-10 [Anolis sagrei ordinatus]
MKTAVLLSLVLILENAHSQLAETNCKYFANALPPRLRELRATFNRVKEYFQTQDEELDIMLLKEDLLEDFKGYLGCQSVGEMIQFYLEDVLPNVSSSNTINQDVDFLGDLLLELRQLIKRCHRYFICEKKSKTIKDIKDTYKKLQDKGIYKAMGEFDTFINYIEEYLMMKMRR